MGLFDIFKSNKNKQYQYVKMLSGNYPVFSQFGQNIYASDIVQMSIDKIATEISKLQPKHIRIDNNEMQKVVKGPINRLFKFAPNPMMTTRDFLEKIIWLLYMNYNAFIYPMYDIVIDTSGKQTKEYTAFYPLNPNRVEFIQDEAQTLFIKMWFGNGDNYILPYSNVIHLRKKFSVNDIMGGGLNGQPDNAALLKALEINDTVLQGLGKAIKTSLSVRGVLKINSLLDGDKQKAEIDRFERSIEDGTSGILPLDLKGEYTDLKPDPKIIDKDTMEFLQSKILNWYGVPLKILSGNFNDEEYQAFYEATLEPIIISLGQAFSKTLFSQRELDVGNEIVFYHRDMMYLSTKAKLELIKIAGEQGLLQDNQKLAILGLPPVVGGERITQSLNYIDKSIINQYQLNGVKAKNNKEE